MGRVATHVALADEGRGAAEKGHRMANKNTIPVSESHNCGYLRYLVIIQMRIIIPRYAGTGYETRSHTYM